MSDEDMTIPRISFCKDLKNCFTAIPGHIRSQYFDYGSNFMASSLTVPEDDPALILTENLADKVPDAVFTTECWYTKPVILTGKPMKIMDFQGSVCFLATERHRPAVYEVLKNQYGFSDQALHELDQIDMFRLVNQVLNDKPEYWEIDECLGDAVGDEAGIPTNMLFDSMRFIDC